MIGSDSEPTPITPNGEYDDRQCSTALSKLTPTTRGGGGLGAGLVVVYPSSQSISAAASSNARCIAVCCVTVGESNLKSIWSSLTVAYAIRPPVPVRGSPCSPRRQTGLDSRSPGLSP